MLLTKAILTHNFKCYTTSDENNNALFNKNTQF